jgi:hypothetical protein
LAGLDTAAPDLRPGGQDGDPPHHHCDMDDGRKGCAMWGADAVSACDGDGWRN